MKYPAEQPKAEAIVVEQITSGSLAAQAGLQPGDRLWIYAGQHLRSPAHLQALEENTFGVERLTLHGERDAAPLELVVIPGKLGIDTRPALPVALLPAYETARAALLAGQYADAAYQWTELADRIELVDMAVWLLGRAGAAWEKAADWEAALRTYVLAWERLQEDDDTALRSLTATALGRCYQSRSEWQEAVTWYERAGQAEARAGREMWQAQRLTSLGAVAWIRGDLQAAEDHCTRALQIRERLAPGSLEVAQSLTNLGGVAWSRGDLQTARDYYTGSLAIRERLAPGSPDVTDILNNLGVVAWSRGDLQAAQDYHTRVLAIRERLAPGSLEVAQSLTNLGAVAYDRGDLQAAQDYYTRALQIRERLAPGSLDVAQSLSNLGNVAWSRGDLLTARDYYTDSLTIRERLAPGSLEVAQSLSNLGNVDWSRGDLQAAQNNLTRSLQIRERHAPGSLDVAASLSNLGNVARDRGDTALAQDFCTRALQIFERLAPNSLDTATALTDLGHTYLFQPHADLALPYLKQAVRILEQQRSQIASPEARALLLAQHNTKYVALIQAHLALKQPEIAFDLLELSRARSLLELLSERRLDVTAEAPSHLLEQQRSLDQQRERASTRLAYLSAGAEDAEQVEALHRQIRDLERRQQALGDEMRAVSPQYASLHYIQPLTLAETQAVLEPGTLMLSYLVDKEQTFLFAVTADRGVKPFLLPIGRQALEEKVRSFRDLLDWRFGTNRLPEQVRQAVVLGQELYADLIQPASALLPEARRLLLCPDGPLHILPFAALVTNARGRPRYLGTERTLHSILSATLYARMRSLSSRSASEMLLPPDPDRSPRPAPGFRRLLALGDPNYPAAVMAPAETRSHDAQDVISSHNEETHFEEATPGVAFSAKTASATSDQLEADACATPVEATLMELQTRGMLAPLPHTRAEVLSLQRLFGPAATIRLGSQATKAAVLKEGGDADVLHFACHGFVDAERPLYSGLALSRTETSEEEAASGDSGFLYVWEIFQKLRLAADLVVLSACETGLGQEIRGEGLIGLTRAFQYAGAKSLVVSLWEVNDASTCVFMEAFYGALKSGESKDEAMQAGIEAVRSHPQWSAPYYWSAFVLIGSRT